MSAAPSLGGGNPLWLLPLHDVLLPKTLKLRLHSCHLLLQLGNEPRLRRQRSRLLCGSTASKDAARAPRTNGCGWAPSAPAMASRAPRVGACKAPWLLLVSLLVLFRTRAMTAAIAAPMAFTILSSMCISAIEICQRTFAAKQANARGAHSFGAY